MTGGSAFARDFVTGSSLRYGRAATDGSWTSRRPAASPMASSRGMRNAVSDIFDALVVGGGPSGATTALMLARAGWSVAVVEATAFPRRKVCGEFVSAASLPLLRHLGVAEAFLDLAGPEVRRVGLFARDGCITANMPRLQNERHAWGRALGREHLDTLL